MTAPTPRPLLEACVKIELPPFFLWMESRNGQPRESISKTEHGYALSYVVTMLQKSRSVWYSNRLFTRKDEGNWSYHSSDSQRKSLG